MYNGVTMNKRVQTRIIGAQGKKRGESMKRAEVCNTDREDDVEMMSDGTLKRLMDYLKSVGWSDSEIVKLLDYVADK